MTDHKHCKDEKHVIPQLIWDVVQEKVEQTRQKKQKKKSTLPLCSSSAVLVKRFCYNVHQETWSGECGCDEEQNLFFQYISHTKDKMWKSEDVTRDYISVRFGDDDHHGDERSHHNSPSPNSTRNSYSYQADHIRENILRNGLYSPSEEDHFQILGCSNSQVRKYTFLFRRVTGAVHSRKNQNGKNMRCEHLLPSILPKLQELEQKKGVSKRVKYTGLLFSGVRCFVDLPNGKQNKTIIKEIGSIDRDGFDFTDGTGLISIKLARHISKQMKLNSVPSVFQIRYGGMIDGRDAYICKGVLLVDPTEENQFIISFRKSMKKVQLANNYRCDWTKHMNYKLGIVDYSQKKIGKLNQQVVCLLSANVPHQDLLSVQNFHLENVRQSWHDPFALGFLTAMDAKERMWNTYEQLLMQILDTTYHTTDRLPSAYVTLAQSRTRYCNEYGKLQIHLGESRSVYGVAFPEQIGNILKEGQCLFFTDQGLLVGTIIVSRSPSYTPGDVRVLKSIDLPPNTPLRQLRNCILFSTEGPRPEADKMSGGDLDGDLYLVIWDKRLTKYAAQIGKEEPADYSTPSPLESWNANNGTHTNIQKEDWIEYVSQFDNSMLGIVDRAFFNTAREKGIKSQEAKELNDIFTSLVDKNPASLRKLERIAKSCYITGGCASSSEDCSIWERMLHIQRNCGKEIKAGKIMPDLNDFSSFRQNLIVDSMKFQKKIKFHHDHFMVNVSAARINTILQLLDRTNQQVILDRKDKNDDQNASALHRLDLNNKFQVMCTDLKGDARKLFASAFEQWDQKRKVLLKELTKQRNLQQEGLTMFDKEREMLKHSSKEYIKEREKKILAIVDEIGIDCNRGQKEMFDTITRLKDRLPSLRRELAQLKQSILSIYATEINLLSMKDEMIRGEIEKQQERLSNLRWTFTSFLGVDSERNMLTNELSTLSSQSEVVLDNIARVNEQRAIFEAGNLRTEAAFVGDTKLAFSDNFYSSFSRGKEWEALRRKIDTIQKKIREYELSLCDFDDIYDNWIQDKWGSIDIGHYSSITQHTLQKFGVEKKLHTGKEVIASIEAHSSITDIEMANLDGRCEAFINGNFRNEIEFQVDKLKIETKQNKKMLENSEEELYRLNIEVEGVEKKVHSLENVVARLEKKRISLYEFKEEFESLFESERDAFEAFGREMMFQSSYLLLEKIVRKNVNSDPFWKIITQDFFQRNDINERDVEENPMVLHMYFQRSKDALECIFVERERRSGKNRTESKEMTLQSKKLQNKLDKAGSEKALLENDLVQVQKDLVAKRRKRKKLKKRKTNEVETSIANDLNEILSQIDHLVNQREDTQRSLKKKNASIDEIQVQLQQVKDRTSEKAKSFDLFCKACDAYGYKANDFLGGEVAGAISSDLFIKIYNIVLRMNDLGNLKRKFVQIMTKMDKKTDRDILMGRKTCIDLCKHSYSDEKLKTLNNQLDQESNNLRSTMAKLLDMRGNIESLEVKCSKMRKELKVLEEQLNSTRKSLNEMFWKERLEELEVEWQNSSHEDSLNCAMKCIENVMKSTTQEWEEIMCSGESDEKINEKLCKMKKRIQQVIWIEKNRIFGSGTQERLPVFDKRAELLKCLQNSNAVIITAGTGCGKSTQLPQYIADDFYAQSERPVTIDGRGDNARICCTQPRRLAAQGVASRVAKEYYTSLGDLVGYRVGKRGSILTDSKRVSKDTRIEYVTEGLLLYELTKSPEKIQNYDCIIVDEAHERNKETDLLLALLRQHLNGDSPCIKLVVMSATIDPTKFREYFGGACPTMDCPGRVFPVEEHFFPPPPSETSGGSLIDIDHAVHILFDEILHKFGEASNFEDGDVLIFLSSSAQITLCVDKINSKAQKDSMPFVVAYPLFAQMTEVDKEAAKNPDHRTGLDKITDGKHKLSRKIICCTNIAETSLTIDRVRFVIEGGHAKRPTFDHAIRSVALNERQISQASAKQRKGRAGRTASGRCYFLYSKSTHASMSEYDLPQILDTPVDELIMYSLDVCGKSIEHLGLMDCPNTARIDAAKERLIDLDMIEIKDCGSVSLTEDGEIACRLSTLDPQAVRMILRARSPELNCLHRAIKLGAILSSDEDMFVTMRQEKDNSKESTMLGHDLGDHFVALTTFERYEAKRKKVQGGNTKSIRNWCKVNGLVYYVVDRIQNTIEQSYRDMKKFNFLKEQEPLSRPNDYAEDENERLLKACVSGYFSQLAEWIPLYFTKLGFSMLGSSTNNARLCKESCMYALLSTDDGFEDYDSDEDSNGDFDNDSNINNDGDGNDDDIKDSEEKRELSENRHEFKRNVVNFILYTNMFSINTCGNKSLILIPKISLINGKWITDYAPESWRHRAQFDENKPSVCRRTISHIGVEFQSAALQLFRKNQYREQLAVFLHVVWNRSKLFLFGKKEHVNEVKEAMKKLISIMREKRLKNDLVRTFPDNAAFGPGFELKTIGKDKPRYFFLAKGGKGNTEPVNYTYWNIRNEQNKPENMKKRMHHTRGGHFVTIFINDGNDAGIFCLTLQKLLQPKRMDCKVISDKIEVSFLEDRSRSASLMEVGIVKDTIEANRDLFSPEIVNEEASTNFLCEKDSKEIKSRLKEIWQSVEEEWLCSVPFWQTFCTDLQGKGKSRNRVKVRYVPSRSRFEIYSASDNLRSKVKQDLMTKLLDMCRPKKCWIHNPDLVNIWKVTAVLGEMRLQYPSIRFTLIFNESGDLNMDEDTIRLDEPDTISTSKAIGIQTDLECMQYLSDNGQSIHGLSIVMQCPFENYGAVLSTAKQVLKKLLPSNTIVNPDELQEGGELIDQGKKITKSPHCSMCCRPVSLNREKQGKGNHDERAALMGYRLALCGCIFCRQCFFTSVLMKLKSHSEAQCERCDSIVLAHDCEKIVKQSFYNKQIKQWTIDSENASYYQADWKRLLTLSYEIFCFNYAKLVPSHSFITCRDCMTVMIINKRWKYVSCRNLKCQSLICTDCGLPN